MFFNEIINNSYETVQTKNVNTGEIEYTSNVSTPTGVHNIFKFKLKDTKSNPSAIRLCIAEKSSIIPHIKNIDISHLNMHDLNKEQITALALFMQYNADLWNDKIIPSTKYSTIR